MTERICPECGDGLVVPTTTAGVTRCSEWPKCKYMGGSLMVPFPVPRTHDPRSSWQDRIVFTEEVATTDDRGSIIVIERGDGRREWVWASEVPAERPT